MTTDSDSDLFRRTTAWLTRPEGLTFFFLVVTMVVARGPALTSLGYSIDDYRHAINPVRYDTVLVANGRFVQAVVLEALYRLGASGPAAAAVFGYALVLAMAYAAIITLRLWRLDDKPTVCCLVGAFFCLHPYHAELVTFKAVLPLTAGSISLAFLGLHVCWKRAARIIPAACVIAIAIGMYQIVLTWIVAVLVMGALISLVRFGANDSLTQFRVLKTDLGAPLAATVLGTGFYVVSLPIIWRLTGVAPLGRGMLLALDEGVIERLRSVGGLYRRLFMESEQILPMTTKVLIAALLGGAIVVIMLSGRQGRSWRQAWGYYAVASALIVAGALSIVGLAAPLQVWWPVPRVLTAISLVWSGIVSLTLITTHRTIRRGATAVLLVVLVSFASLTNRVATDQLRRNLHDASLATRIVARLENHPGFANVRAVAVMGGMRGFPDRVGTASMDLNLTAYYPSWSKMNILREVSGYDFAIPNEEQMRRAREYDATAQKWPHPDSVTVNGDLGIVCLPRP